jgi:hypothetical protein
MTTGPLPRIRTESGFSLLIVGRFLGFMPKRHVVTLDVLHAVR